MPKVPGLLGTVLLLMMCATLSAQTNTTPPAPSMPSAPSTSVLPSENLFKKLFTTIARDVRHLPSRENASILFNGAVMALIVVPIDDEVTEAASSSRQLKAMYSGWGKALGREWVQGGGALAAYVAGALWDKPRMVRAAGDLIEAQLVAVTTTQGLKFAFSRERPDGEARSFPSGHASAAFATATVLQRHFGRAAGIPAYAVAVYTSTSRLQANSHYPSDVIFGAALGMAIAQTATRDFSVRGVQIMPSADAHGLRVMLSIR